MDFPALRPTSRSFDPGNYPVKTFKAQNGAEVRILYGSTRTNMKMQLSYANLTDANAELFLDHFDAVQGTFQTFVIGGVVSTKGGWEGDNASLSAAGANKFRYESAPQLTQVRPGISTVTVNLIGVF